MREREAESAGNPLCPSLSEIYYIKHILISLYIGDYIGDIKGTKGTTNFRKQIENRIQWKTSLYTYHGRPPLITIMHTLGMVCL